jgi:SOS-response transcriptional repressor LexA
LPVKGSEKSFAIKITDDSMIPQIPGKKCFLVDDIIFIDPLEKPQHLNYILAFEGDADEPIMRQFVADGDKSFLRPLNPDYRKIIIDKSIQIVGVVIGHLATL